MVLELQCSCDFNWLPDVVSLATGYESDQITKPERVEQVAALVFVMHPGRHPLLHLTGKLSSTPTIPTTEEIQPEPFKNWN